MKKITNIHCKIYLTYMFSGTMTSEWKYMEKTINENGDTIRKFSHEKQGVVEIIQNGNYLSIYNRITMNVTEFSNETWQEYLVQHFSHRVYAGNNFTLKEMLDMYLATVEHSLQHDSGYAKYTIYNQAEGVEVDTGNMEPLFIAMNDLKNFGYVPKPNQSAEDFIAEHWNWY